VETLRVGRSVFEKQAPIGNSMLRIIPNSQSRLSRQSKFTLLTGIYLIIYYESTGNAGFAPNFPIDQSRLIKANQGCRVFGDFRLSEFLRARADRKG
jgi:hypothetical protein